MHLKSVFSFFLLYFLLNLLFCGTLNAATSALGMTFGKTTEETLKKRYPEMTKLDEKSELEGDGYEIKSGNFAFDGVKRIYVFFDHQKNLTAFLVINKLGSFGLITAVLSKKYETIYSYTSLFGSKYIKMHNENVAIYLSSPFFSLNSLVLYIKADIQEKVSRTFSEETQRSEVEMMNSIIDYVFPSAKIFFE